MSSGAAALALAVPDQPSGSSSNAARILRPVPAVTVHPLHTVARLPTDRVREGLCQTLRRRSVSVDPRCRRQRRRRSGRLARYESDRLYRLARIVALADEFLGDHEKALDLLEQLPRFHESPGRRERFDRQKVLNGLMRACEKRPVSIGKLEQIVNEAEAFVIDSPDRERKTSEIGSLIMERLKKYDKVAYVRFASVYLDFKDVKEFMDELKGLLKDRAKK